MMMEEGCVEWSAEVGREGRRIRFVCVGVLFDALARLGTRSARNKQSCPLKSLSGSRDGFP